MVFLALCGLAAAASSDGGVETLESSLADAAGPARAEVLAALVDGYRNSDPRRAVAYGREGLLVLDEHPNALVRIRVLNEMVWALRLLGEFQEALALGAEASELARRVDDRQGLARALNNLGVVYWYLGDLDRVLEYWLAALDLRQELDDEEGVAGSLNNIGLVYGRMGEHRQAIERYREALAISAAAVNLEFVVNHLDNMGESFTALGDYETAAQHYQQALTIAREEGNHKGEISVLINLGSLMLELGRDQEAARYLNDGLAQAQALSVATKQVEAAMQLARLALRQGDAEAALEIAEPSLVLAGELEEKTLRRDLHELISESYAALGEDRLALAAYRAFTEVQADLFDEQRQDRINQLQIRFEAEQQERQIQLLTQQNEIRDLQLQAAAVTRSALIAGVVALSGFVALLILGYRQKTRSNDTIRRQVVELEAARSRLQELAVTDPLTGLLNRRAFQEQLDRELARVHRRSGVFSIGLLDVDHFKRINDSHGHDVGDAFLVALAERIRSSVRENDVVARWGGEEFVMLYPDTNADQAMIVAERVRQAVDGTPFTHADLTVAVSATIGISQYVPEGQALLDVIKAADDALYAGKRAGRNQVMVRRSDAPPAARKS